MLSALPVLVNCPHCMAQNPDAEDRCQACGRPLTLYIGPAELVPRRIGLGSLMLLIALIAVCLVVVRESLPLGVILLATVVPALFRTIQWSAQCVDHGRPMTLIEKVLAFIACVTLVWLLLLCGVIAFGVCSVIVCFVTLPLLSTYDHFGALVPAFVLGAAGAVATIYYLGRALWSVQGFYQKFD